MRRSVCLRSSGGQDNKKTTTATVKLSKLRSSNRINDLHHKSNMPVYNIIARRHKVHFQSIFCFQSCVLSSFFTLSLSHFTTISFS